MKNLLVLFFFPIFFSSCIVSSKPNMDFASDIKRPKGTRIVSINAPMFLAKPFIIHALKEDGENPEMIQLFKKIKKVRVMCIEMDSTQDNKAYQKDMDKKMNYFLNQKKYSEYATIRNNGQKVAIHAVQDGDRIKNLMIQTISPKEGNVYVFVKANITPDELTNFINQAQDK